MRLIRNLLRPEGGEADGRVTREILLILLVFLASNLVLGLYYWLPQRNILALFTVVPESAVVSLLIIGISRFSRRRRLLLLPLLLLPVSLVVLFGLGESFYQFVYREHFVPWRDLAFLPGFMNMIFSTNRFAQPVILGVTLIVPVLLTMGILFFLFRFALERSARLPWRAVALVAPPLLLSTLTLLGGQPWRYPITARLIDQALPPTPPEYAAEELEPSREEPLPLLGGGDLRVFIIESYGHTLFSREDHNRLIMPIYDYLEEDLEDSGYSIVSHFMRSPAFGGRSWLADGTILSGVWLGDQAAYDGVKESDRRTIIDVMNQAGYETVIAAPGMTYFDPGYREFYRFDRFYIQRDFTYRGPHYTFGRLPDQYLLRYMRERTEGVESPLFTTYVMVSSHVPFRIVPPYFEDWDGMGDGSIYHRVSPTVFDNNWLSGGEYPEGYTASIEYSLKSAVDYVRLYLEEGDIAVIIGDHQPRIPISERSSTYSVPVHILSKLDRQVAPFKERGFVDGLVPSQEPPHPRMDTLYPLIYEVLIGVPAVESLLAP
ncbi:MAG: hypothetical protein ACOC45_02605 [Alkalispirochaetaceae bacterium]